MSEPIPVGAQKYPPPEWMPDDVAAVWREIVQAHIDAGDDQIARKVGPAMEAYCAVVADLRAATAAVSADAPQSRLIADARGNGIEHPALAVKNNANRELQRWGDRFQAKQRPAGRGRRGAR